MPWGSMSFVRARNQNSEASGSYRERNGRAGGMDFAIGVNRTGRRTCDNECRGAQVSDAGGTVERAGKEAGKERQGVERTDRCNGGEVQEAVVDAGTRRNAGVVAVLVGIRDRDGESPEGGRGAIVGDRVVARAIGAQRGGARRKIAKEAAVNEAVETLGNLGLKAEAGGGKERVSVGEARIDETGMSGAKDGQRAMNWAVDTEVAAKAVARAAGDESQRGRGADEDRGDFVEGAVSADRDDKRATGGHSTRGQLRSVTGKGRQGEFGTDRRGIVTDFRQRAEGTTGAGIDDKDRVQRNLLRTTDCRDGTDRK